MSCGCPNSPRPPSPPMVAFTKGDGEIVHILPSAVATVEALSEDPDAQALIRFIGNAGYLRVRENHEVVVKRLTGEMGLQTRG